MPTVAQIYSAGNPNIPQPKLPTVYGKYVLQHGGDGDKYVALPNELPAKPDTDGTYVLQNTVAEGTATIAWAASEEAVVESR